MIRLDMIWPFASSTWAVVIAAAFLFGAGFSSGFAFKGRLAAAEAERIRGDIARMEAAHAEEKQAAAAEAARRLAAAAEAEREAQHALAATRARLATTQKRLKESLYALSTASHCGLSAGAVGLLDRAAAGKPLPAGAAEPDRAATGSSADPARPAASEAAVGAWIGDAVRAYGECRARLDAIRQWDEVTYGR